jgi:AcrR family transcriptional regulator
MKPLPCASGSRPLRRDAEKNRQRIMAAAREVFARRGFDATLDDIAHHAGLGVGTVYRRFPNKAALIDALFEESFQRVVDLAEKAGRDPDAWAGFVGFMTAIAELQVADRGLRDLMLSGSAGPARVGQMSARVKPIVDRLVRRAQEQGALRCDVAGADVPVFQLMIAAASEFTQVGGPDCWRRYVTLLLDGLRARREEPTELPALFLDEEQIESAIMAWPGGRPLEARG